MNLSEWARELTGLPGDDVWTAYQFDSAVIWFGTYVEGKINEFEDGKPKYRLEDFLSDQPVPQKTPTTPVKVKGPSPWTPVLENLRKIHG